jgi:hypothetical protein
VGLTLVVVVVAIRRLGLYDEAFGLTMLRLYSTAFAWWLGGVLLLVGLHLVTAPRRRWLAAAIGASALACLAVMNVMNPEQVVVEHNLARASDGDDVDIQYLVGLSDDAVPALLASLDDLPAIEQQKTIDLLCRVELHRAGSDPRATSTEWYGYNRSVANAEAAVRQLCSSP